MMGTIGKGLLRPGRLILMSAVTILLCGSAHATPDVALNKLAVNDEFVQPTVDAIVKGAKSEAIGDGKIFVMPMGECIRIRTGEKGNEAIG